MDDSATIGRRIRERRTAMRLTQADLAAAIGVSRAHLTNVELGKGGLAVDKLSLLAKETQTPLAWLLGEDQTAPVSPVEPAEEDQIESLLRAFSQMDALYRETLLTVAQAMAAQGAERRPIIRPKDQSATPLIVQLLIDANEWFENQLPTKAKRSKPKELPSKSNLVKLLARRNRAA